jgi:RimJ/RimL family protein N-acetyltransferase
MPSIVVQTARQTLRLLTPEDAEPMFALNSDPDVLRYTPDLPPRSVEDERAFLVAYHDVYRTDGFARWAAIETATGAWLGWCGLRRQADGEVDVGYRYLKSAWGRGFATEAARASVAYGFRTLGLARLIARAQPANVASLRVLAKIGLRFERREVDHGQDVELWGTSRDEWARFDAGDGRA